MFPTSFFKNIKNKIIPDIMEIIYRLRTELEGLIGKLSERLDKLETQIEMIAKDQHPPVIDLKEWEDVKDTIKKLKRKKAFKRKDG